MIAWEDFDNRSVKVLCDGCHQEIDNGVERLLRNMKKQQLEHALFHRQWNLKLPFFDVAITLFKRTRDRNGATVLRKAKARQW